METRAHYILIGAFMLSGIVLAILFSLWLGSVEREFDEYDIVFNEQVSGLSVGGGVLFNGIKVGEVRDLKLAPNNPKQVIARVRVEKETPVKEDTDAQLELVGVTGLAIIQFSGGTPGTPLLKDTSSLRVPKLVAKPSPFAEILTGSNNIIAGVQRLLSVDNTDTISRILEDVEGVTGGLQGKEEEVGQIIDNVAAISEDIVLLTDRLEKSADRIDTILLSAEKMFVTDIPNSIGEFDATSVEYQQLAEELRMLLGENKEAIEAFTQQGLGEAAGAIADSRRLIQTIDGILLEFERDPTRFLLGDARPEVKAAN
jgi:phospholipid/cholesterol/gamma-HCH transport system substrate-binding protein